MSDKEHWDNKTSTFQSRLDLKVLAELTHMLEKRYNMNFGSVSGLIRDALFTLVQIGRHNEWGEGRTFDTYNDAYIFMMERGLWAISKNDLSRDALNLKLEEERVPIMEVEVDRIVEKVSQDEKDRTDRDKMDEIMKNKEKLLSDLKEGGVLADDIKEDK